LHGDGFVGRRKKFGELRGRQDELPVVLNARNVFERVGRDKILQV